MATRAESASRPQETVCSRVFPRVRCSRGVPVEPREREEAGTPQLGNPASDLRFCLVGAEAPLRLERAAGTRGFSCTVSTRAFTRRLPIFASFAHDGTGPPADHVQPPLRLRGAVRAGQHRVHDVLAGGDVVVGSQQLLLGVNLVDREHLDNLVLGAAVARTVHTCPERLGHRKSGKPGLVTRDGAAAVHGGRAQDARLGRSPRSSTRGWPCSRPPGCAPPCGAVRRRPAPTGCSRC